MKNVSGALGDVRRQIYARSNTVAPFTLLKGLSLIIDFMQ
ncbi:unannotated protein [freshwater metagenome]|uniref:Unannotated protein n=1 Tax=freshwater metagenome TaxID=449393 RepID=A0A6J7W5P1_9ZZZZ